MAEQLYFGRHTKLFLEQGSNVWEIPVLDGFSFSQATNSSDVALAEMESTAGVSRRGSTKFNDSYAPAEWSFSTYVRPVLSTPGAAGGEWETTGAAAVHHAIEEALWANFMAVNAWNSGANTGSAQTVAATPTSTETGRSAGVYVVTEGAADNYSAAGEGASWQITVGETTGNDATDVTVELIAGGEGYAVETVTIPALLVGGGSGDLDISVSAIATKGYWDKAVLSSTSETKYSFSNSNTSTLGTFDLWFDLGNCAPSGDQQPYKIAGCVVNSISIDFDIEGIATINWSGFGNIITDEVAAPAATIYEDISATDNFIRNRLTTLAITAADTTNFPGVSANGVYNAVLTGGSVSFENNITFLTPETLCKVDQPIGHVTGTRSISGSFTSYLNTDTGSTADLFEDLIGATDVVTNEFNLVFSIGGSAAPKLQIALPTCHIEVPNHSIEDVIAVEVNFMALPSKITAANEATITYTGS